jgi:hypothetical protein
MKHRWEAWEIQHFGRKLGITTPIFIGLNRTQKPQMPQEENSAGKDKELCSQTNIFGVNNKNTIALKHL